MEEILLTKLFPKVKKFREKFLFVFFNFRLTKTEKQEQLKSIINLEENLERGQNKFNFRHIAQFVIYNPTSHHQHQIKRKVFYS